MVLSKLKELQNEVAPLMKTMESLKDKDTAKDPKTLISVLQKEYNVSKNLFLLIDLKNKFNFFLF